MIAPAFEPHQCLLVGAWRKTAQLPYWPPRGQQVSHKEGVTCMLLASANKAAHSGFKTRRRRHQKSKTGLSVAPQKGVMSLKNVQKEYMPNAI